jgi:hypothetical protein
MSPSRRAPTGEASFGGRTLIIRVDDLPIVGETRSMVADFIDALSWKYKVHCHHGHGQTGTGAEIDPGSKDIAKKIGVPGTWKCKGPQTEERPRRRVTIERMGEAVKPIDLRAWLNADRPASPEIILKARATLHRQTAAFRYQRRSRRWEIGDIDEARLWLQKQAPAISGFGGRRHTFRTVATDLKGWDLTPAEALLLIEEWNLTCQRPWDRPELIEKIREADRWADPQPRGYMRDRVARGRERHKRRALLLHGVPFDLSMESRTSGAREFETKGGSMNE